MLVDNLERPPQREERRATSFRIPTSALRLIDEAANREHTDRTTFVLAAAVARAQEVLRDRVVFDLNVEAFDALLDHLDNPPTPSNALRTLLHKKPLWEQVEADR